MFIDYVYFSAGGQKASYSGLTAAQVMRVFVWLLSSVIIIIIIIIIVISHSNSNSNSNNNNN